MTQASAATQSAVDPKPPRTRNNRFAFKGVAFIVVCCVIVLVFLGIQNKTRGMLSSEQITQSLRDPSDPEGVVYALQALRVRMGERQDVHQWYPDLLALASSRDDQVQHTVADLMGLERRSEFHEALLALLRGNSLLVRNAAAISLAQYDDSAGREQVISMLHPQPVTSPSAGRIDSVVSLGRYVSHGDVIAKLHNGGILTEVPSPVTGTVHSVSVQDGDVISAGIDVAVVEPGAEQVIAALHALERIGYAEDLEMLNVFASEKAPPDVREQTRATQQAIRARAKK